MAYPGNDESFGNIAVDYPSIIVKNAHSDQKFMMIQESNEKKLHMHGATKTLSFHKLSLRYAIK